MIDLGSDFDSWLSVLRRLRRSQAWVRITIDMREGIIHRLEYTFSPKLEEIKKKLDTEWQGIVE